MGRPVRVRVRDFIPDEDLFVDTADGIKLYARGVLCDHLRYVVWDIVMTDAGERMEDKLGVIHQLTQKAWLADSAVALRAIARILEPIERKIDAAVKRGVPVAAVTREHGDWHMYSRARGIFYLHHRALVRLGVADANAEIGMDRLPGDLDDAARAALVDAGDAEDDIMPHVRPWGDL